MPSMPIWRISESHYCDRLFVQLGDLLVVSGFLWGGQGGGSLANLSSSDVSINNLWRKGPFNLIIFAFILINFAACSPGSCSTSYSAV